MPRDRQEDIREEMARAEDTMRGLGTHLSLDDMRCYGERMQEAALPTRAEMEAYYAEESERMRQEFAEIEEDEHGLPPVPRPTD
jgi:hypothetical protein